MQAQDKNYKSDVFQSTTLCADKTNRVTIRTVNNARRKNRRHNEIETGGWTKATQ